MLWRLIALTTVLLLIEQATALQCYKCRHRTIENCPKRTCPEEYDACAATRMATAGKDTEVSFFRSCFKTSLVDAFNDHCRENKLKCDINICKRDSCNVSYRKKK